MIAIASVHARALAGPPERDPHLLHGLLYLAEAFAGADAALAHAVGLEPEQFATLTEKARSGYYGRAIPGGGRERPEGDEQAVGSRAVEYFTVPWYRIIIEKMLSPEGALTADYEAVAADFDLTAPISKLVVRLRGALNREGLRVQCEPCGTGIYAFRYTIRGVDADRLTAIIANGWRREQ